MLSHLAAKKKAVSDDSANSNSFLCWPLYLIHFRRDTVSTEGDDIKLYDIENNDNGVLEVSFYASLEEGKALLPVDALEAAVLVSILISLSNKFHAMVICIGDRFRNNSSSISNESPAWRRALFVSSKEYKNEL